MEKIIILSYLFPPCNLTAADRINGWAKNLHRHGYYPIVITRNWEIPINRPKDAVSSTGNEIVHQKFDEFEVYYLPYKATFRDFLFKKFAGTPFQFLSKFFTFLELLSYSFTNHFISNKNLYSYTDTLLNQHPDIKKVIISGSPFVLFKFGYQLKKKHQIEWIADYRDDWTTNEIANNRSFHYKVKHFIDTFYEKKWLKNVTCFTSVSIPYIKKISTFIKKPGHLVENGFSDEISAIKKSTTTNEFSIVYSGTLYENQPIELFIQAFKQFVDKYDRKFPVRIHFIGTAFDDRQKKRVEISFKGYENFYLITPRLQKSDYYTYCNNASAFLMTNYNELKGIPTSKLYEYLAFQKAIIVCPSDNDIIEKTITDSKLGLLANNSDEALACINALYNAFCNKETFSKNIDLSAINKHSQLETSKQLATILNTFR